MRDDHTRSLARETLPNLLGTVIGGVILAGLFSVIGLISVETIPYVLLSASVLGFVVSSVVLVGTIPRYRVAKQHLADAEVGLGESLPQLEAELARLEAEAAHIRAELDAARARWHDV